MKDQGEIIELRFQMECIHRGLIVSSPYGDNQKYDFIVDGKTLSRVQVKSSARYDTATGSRDGRYHVSIGNGNRSKRAYSKDEVDIIAIYIIPEDAWYFIPIENIQGLRTINLYPHTRDSRGKYEEYRSWDIF